MTLQLDPPAPPARRSTSTICDLHPGESFTGFCAACLRERLVGLEASAAASAAPGRKSTSAIRSLFARPFGAGGSSASGAAEPPDLRRCKSFSCGRGGDALAAAVAAGTARADEPQRRSCDVRGRSKLWALFHQDDRDRVRDGTAFGAFPASSSTAEAALAADVLPQTQPPCFPDDFLEEYIPVVMESDEIIPVVEPVIAMDTSGEMEAELNAAPEGKAIKDHIDLVSSQSKKASPKDLKEIAGSFWVAASVFSKKWQKWRRKQKLKKEAAVSKAAAAAMPPLEKPSKPSFLRRRRLRGEAGSELAGGRRSCDTDPRFSLDAARMSVDDAGFSWDEPRASWDGYLFGAGGGIGLGRAPPPLSRLPPILSVLEDNPADIIERSDGQIPVEDDGDPDEPPGGSLQTRDYYFDSSSRRRRSLERSSSVRRPSFEITDQRLAPAVANGKESPIGGSEFYHFHHAEDLLDRGFSSNSLIEDISASLEAALSGPAKKPRGWRKAWSLWGLIHRRAAGRRSGGPSDIADRSFSEPWPDLRVRGANPKMQRCNNNQSARSSFSSNSGGLGSSRRSYVDANGNVKRRDQEHVQLERNRSARYSPGRAADNGMLRFYLTPMRSGSARRGGGLPSKAGPGRPLATQSFARSVLRLY
ncbi:protein OCTOPUS-like [Phragmites australis]|uniref:protein OCTOPUS-like n=1 Tax=Phragmites australis TaxID=29695 RepID=UPI002D77FB4C|nr:protein OCTOPUS-like [Phragmites australis]